MVRASSFVLLNFYLTPWSRSFHEKLIVPELVKEFPAFMKPKVSLPYSQQPDICPYPDAD